MKEKPKQEICREYAGSALDQLKEARKRNLSGLVAPVWSDDYALHYNWCLNAAPAEITGGQGLREAVLGSAVQTTAPPKRIWPVLQPMQMNNAE